MIASHIKEYAYTLDPECWKSYSGKSIQFKQLMEVRRNASLEKAAADIADNERQHARLARTRDLAGQWEHIARYIALRMFNMPGEVFDVIVSGERERYIKGSE